MRAIGYGEYTALVCRTLARAPLLQPENIRLPRSVQADAGLSRRCSARLPPTTSHTAMLDGVSRQATARGDCEEAGGLVW